MFFLTAITLVITFIYIKRRLGQMQIGCFTGRHVLITGCDSGFGNQLAKQLDSLGFTVFAGCLTEKSGSELKKSASPKLQIIPLDVTSAVSIAEALKLVKSKLPVNKGLYGLVNNAGIGGPMGHVEMLLRKDYDQTLDVNLYGMIEMTRMFLPLLRLEKGRIVNMTSINGRIAVASAPYVVSKYAAEGYSDTLRRDLYKTGVSVHIIEPGFFRTNILNPETLLGSYDTSFSQSSEEVRKYYGEKFPRRVKNIFKYVISRSSTNTEWVVDAYVQALCSRFPKYRYKVGKDANTLFTVLWNMPEWITDYVLASKYPIPAGTLKR